MRLIDADELIEQIEEQANSRDTTMYEPTVCDIENIINQSPTIDPWQYPSKGAYPKENAVVLCLQSDGITPFIGVYSDKWYNWYTKFIYEFEPKCWQYIILPKEEACPRS